MIPLHFINWFQDINVYPTLQLLKRKNMHKHPPFGDGYVFIIYTHTYLFSVKVFDL